MEKGDLTIADMARWFGRSFSTTRAWVRHGTAPIGPNTGDAVVLLKALERLQRQGQMCAAIVPADLPTINEYCRKRGISRATFYTWKHLGKLTTTRLQGRQHVIEAPNG